jgi:hypothetical protein
MNQRHDRGRGAVSEEYVARVRTLCEDLHANPVDSDTQYALIGLLLGSDQTGIVEGYKRRLRIALEELASNPHDTDARYGVLQLLTGLDVQALLVRAFVAMTPMAVRDSE